MHSGTRAGSITNFIKIFNLLEPILEGIQTFNNRHPSPSIVHLDIKPQNILLLRSKLYLIDYGLLSAHDEVYANNRTHILSSDYPWYPPEFKAYAYPTKGGSYDKLFSRINDNFANIEPEIGQAIVTVLKMNPKKDFEAFYKQNTSKKRYIQFADKIDIYSLGIVLFQLYLWSGYHQRRYQRPALSKYATIRTEVIELIKGMIQFDPTRRLTITQALKQYRQIKAMM
jgi:serine/threonine protein kinase